jgi:predicted GIY-YIG superfamily endonuclease
MRSAIDREKQIKNWRREKKELLVQIQNPPLARLEPGLV